MLGGEVGSAPTFFTREVIKSSVLEETAESVRGREVVSDLLELGVVPLVLVTQVLERQGLPHGHDNNGLSRLAAQKTRGVARGGTQG
eukprot:14428719-Alexandrium_andersonii.AAC.1